MDIENLAVEAKIKTFQEELVAALSRELEIAKRISSGERSNKLIEGRLKKSSGKNYIYEFEELVGFPPEEGVQISFTVKDRSTNGRFLGEVNSKYLFEVDENFGEKIEEANVVSDPLFLIQRQIDLLSENAPYESKVALSSIGLAPKPSVDSFSIQEKLKIDLNKAQAKSIDIAATESVTYIWGPPGTGKTTALGSVVASLLLSNKKVLLVSNTNLALDTALERCIDRIQQVFGIEDGVMLRLGNMVKPELIKKYESKIELDKVYEKQAQPINKKIGESTVRLKKLKDRIDELDSQLEEYENYRKKLELPEVLELQIKNLESELGQKKDFFEQLLSKSAALETELAESEKKSGLGRLFSGKRNPGQIRSDINQIQRNKEQNEKSIVKINEDLKGVREVSKNASVEAKKAERWLASNQSQAKLSEELRGGREESSTLSSQIESLNEELSRLRSDIVRQAQVIACTAYRPLLDRDISDMQFDVVVVDEVSMLPLPLFLCSAYRAKERIVVAGDFRQLPPIVRVGGMKQADSNTNNIDNRFREILTANPFTFSKVKEKFASDSGPDGLVALRDQYRMRSEISDLISSTFYPEHTLKTVNEKLDKPTPWGNETFIIFDTTALSPESSTVNGRSRRNLIHALVAQAVCQELFESGWELDSTAKKSFGVVTPYASQSRFIESMLTGNHEFFIKGGVSTVHRFQGNERDLMIIDLTKVTTDTAPSLGEFIGHPEPLAPENAMWNVAISRARQHVLLIADLSTLERNPTSVISDLYKKMRKEARIVDAADMLHPAALVKKKPQSAKGSIAWFTNEGFYQAFEKDLRGAKEKVLVLSPFTAEQATTHWLPAFRDLKAREVKLTVLTRPPEEKHSSSNPESVHAKLQEVFDELKTVPKMHEKLAVIDQRTVWLGSLNILSHYSASEVMLRIESPDFAESLINEYQKQRLTSSDGSRKRFSSTSNLKAGQKCSKPGCGGTIEQVPGGYSKKTQKRYEAFLSCSNYRRTGCKGS